MERRRGERETTRGREREVKEETEMAKRASRREMLLAKGVSFGGGSRGMKAMPREVVGVAGVTSRRNGAAFGVEGSRAIGGEE